MQCNLYWVLFVQFSSVVCCTIKLKYALWFAAKIGNMQFSRHGRWAHPYPGISSTFWRCRRSTLIKKLLQASISIKPRQTWINHCKFSAYLSNFFTWFLELVLPFPSGLHTILHYLTELTLWEGWVNWPHGVEDTSYVNSVVNGYITRRFPRAFPFILRYWEWLNFGGSKDSLKTSLHTPPGEKQSGERNRISGLIAQKRQGPMRLWDQ